MVRCRCGTWTNYGLMCASCSSENLSQTETTKNSSSSPEEDSEEELEDEDEED